MNKQKSLLIIIILIFFSVIIIKNTIFIVKETEQVVITQFGKPIGKPILSPGIKIKAPFIHEKNTFDKRFLEWDGDPKEVITRDKRAIWINIYARWRISDPLLFLQSVQNEIRAQSRLDDILEGKTRNAIASHNLVELIRTSSREFDISDEMDTLQKISNTFNIHTGRAKITKQIIESSQESASELGIELLDMRFKRINYVDAVREKIFERMITERKRMADKFRSEGQGEASKILGTKERELKQITSEAYKTAQEIKGRADAEATTIYAKAYNQSLEAREFYRFTQTMETYKNTLSEKDWLILSTKSDFFGYLQKYNTK